MPSAATVETIKLQSSIGAAVVTTTVRAIATGKMVFLREAVDNAGADAHATVITIAVERNALTISDNGSGFTPEGCDKYVSLFGSGSAQDDKKGRFCTGAKTWTLHAHRVEVRTVSAEDLQMVVSFAFTTDELARALNHDYTIVAKREPRNGKNFPASLSTGSVIRFTEFFPGMLPTADAIIEQLGDYVAPWYADMVRVNGKPLTRREIIGETFEHDVDHPVLGMVRVRLFVPARRTREEEFRIGAYRPVCTFREFTREMDRPILALVPDIFFHPDVCGIIDVPAFNRYSTQGRGRFDIALYESDVLQEFLRLLDIELSEELVRRIGNVRRAEDSEEDRQLLEEVQAHVNGVYHYTPLPVGGIAPPLPERMFAISVRNVELCPGDRQVFRARHYTGMPSGLSWDQARSGGELDTDQGAEVLYTAGVVPGRFTLTLTNTAVPGMTAESTIVIVTTKAFTTQPRRITLERGETVTVYARNVHLTSGKIRWKPDRCGGAISDTEGSSVKYTAGHELGEFELVVEDRIDHAISFTIPIEIVDVRHHRGGGSPGPGRRRATPRNEVAIRGKIFVLDTTDLDQSSLTVHVGEGRGTVIVFINVAHPLHAAARLTGREARKMYVLAELATVYASQEHPNDMSAMASLRGEVLAELFKQ